MPNHMTNKLRIIGTSEQVKEVLTFIQIEKEDNNEIFGPGTIDLNKITPMPKWVYRGNLGQVEEEKYGAENCWHEWSRKNWGTKWNAYGQSLLDETENIIIFQTAWNSIPDLIFRLARLFPEVILEYSHASEDLGHNIGKYEFKDTDMLSNYIPEGGSKEAYEMAFDIMDITPEDYDMVFNSTINNYEYREE